MIFFVNAEGTTQLVKPSAVYRGSANVNEIAFVAPFARGNAVAVAFKLPNGLNTELQLMTPATTSDVADGYNAWTYLLDSTVTEHEGNVQVQFYVYQPADTTAILATYTSAFPVQVGVAPELPATPTQTIYEQILQYLSTIGDDVEESAERAEEAAEDAEGSATAAAASATAAANSAIDADASATAAAASATAAAASAEDAADSADDAADSAEQTYDDVVSAAGYATRAENAYTSLISQKGNANGIASLGANGKIPVSQIPTIVRTDYFPITSESELTTLTNAEPGDIAYTYTTDQAGKKTVTAQWQLLASPYSVRANWAELSVGRTATAAYADSAGTAEDAEKINGVPFNVIKQSEYEPLLDKTGIWLVKMGE